MLGKRVVCFSDLHNKFPTPIPDGDILLFAGDFSHFGTREEADRFFKWLRTQPHKIKVAIPGNHDAQVEDGDIPELGDVHLLIHEARVIDGISFFGSPYTPTYKNYAFMATNSELEELWKDIPEKTDILITHGPPKGVLDRNMNDISCGCEHLARYHQRAKLHVFGHIHEQGGLTAVVGNTTCVNASMVMYRDLKLKHHPVVVDV